MKDKKPKIPSDWKRARSKVIEYVVQMCYKPVSEGGYPRTVIQTEPNTAVMAETPFGNFTGFTHCLAQDKFDAGYGQLLAFQRAGSQLWRELTGNRLHWNQEIDRIGVDEWLNRVKGAT